MFTLFKFEMGVIGLEWVVVIVMGRRKNGWKPLV